MLYIIVDLSSLVQKFRSKEATKGRKRSRYKFSYLFQNERSRNTTKFLKQQHLIIFLWKCMSNATALSPKHQSKKVVNCDKLLSYIHKFVCSLSYKHFCIPLGRALFLDTTYVFLTSLKPVF